MDAILKEYHVSCLKCHDILSILLFEPLYLTVDSWQLAGGQGSLTGGEGREGGGGTTGRGVWRNIHLGSQNYISSNFDKGRVQKKERTRP